MHFSYPTALVLLLCTGNAFASAIPSSLVLHEKRSFEPSWTNWVKRSIAPRDVILPIRIAIAQRNAEGHNHLMDISDPDSPNFGKHWTPQEVHDFFAPPESTLNAVREWLSSSGITASRHKIAGSRGYIKFDASIEEVERLLGTQYDLWEDSETGAQTVSCDSYSVPAHVKHHVDFITPTTGLKVHTGLTKRSSPFREPLRKPIGRFASAANSLAASSCADVITPECVRTLYGIPSTPSFVKGNDLGVFESGDAYAQEDLDLFFTNYAPHIPNGTHPVLQSIDGGVAPVPEQEAGGESALDFDLAYPLVYPQPIKLFQTLDADTAFSKAGVGLWDEFLDALDGSFCTYAGGDNTTIDPSYPNAGYNGTHMCGTYQPTNVVSISYGAAEAYFPPAYEERQCYEYMKLGLQGTSIIFSSGDNGTVSRAGLPGCLAGGSDNPSFPASCPYVTAVGATQIPVGGSAKGNEIAVDPNNEYSFSSGGGFSNVFARPSYQKTAVSSYLSNNKRDRSLFNAAGRAFPDVAANGWNIATYVGGGFFLNAGTSASAPIFASIINRINGDRITAGKGPLGFLNPTFYANPGVFNDINKGYNLGCNAQPAFNATRGWDPVTGLGTPDFPKLHKLLLSLP